MTKDSRKPRENVPKYDGPDRRQQPDRRAKPRGGRRATDTFKRLALSAYKLLTDPLR